jgi:hypothetical protein
MFSSLSELNAVFDVLWSGPLPKWFLAQFVQATIRDYGEKFDQRLAHIEMSFRQLQVGFNWVESESPGVYLMFDAEMSVCLYVGEAVNLHNRLHTEWLGPRWKELCTWDPPPGYLSLVETNCKTDARRLEAHLINRLDPLKNENDRPSEDAKRSERSRSGRGFQMDNGRLMRYRHTCPSQSPAETLPAAFERALA